MPGLIRPARINDKIQLKIPDYSYFVKLKLCFATTPPPLRLSWLADKAVRCEIAGSRVCVPHLAALGAPEPEMQPFDESKFEPMPEVEINPKDEYWVDPDKLE